MDPTYHYLSTQPTSTTRPCRNAAARASRLVLGVEQDVGGLEVAVLPPARLLRSSPLAEVEAVAAAAAAGLVPCAVLDWTFAASCGSTLSPEGFVDAAGPKFLVVSCRLRSATKAMPAIATGPRTAARML